MSPAYFCLLSAEASQYADGASLIGKALDRPRLEMEGGGTKKKRESK